MKIKYRTQNDGMQQAYSIAGGLDCSPTGTIEGNKDMARQEFKDDADINRILRNFGVENQQRTMVQFGEADYTIDLQQAMHSINDTQRAYEKMDPAIKGIYPTFEKFIRGVRMGAVEKDLERLALEKIPAQQKAEIRRELEREKTREQLLRDDDADRVARDIKEGRTSPKVDTPAK